MKCPKCGNEVYPDQFVCGYCGAPNMQRESANAGNTSIYNLDSDAQPKKRRKIKIILIMLLFSVLLGVGIGIVIWRVRSNHKETPYEKLIKTYLKAYEDMDAEALCATLAPKITDKRIEKKGGITYAEMTAETFQSMKESGDRVRYDVTVKETGKLSDDVIERYAKKISEEYGNVTLSDFRRVEVKGKRIYSNVQTKIPDYKEDYNSTFIVGEYNGELKIISTVKDETE